MAVSTRRGNFFEVLNNRMFLTSCKQMFRASANSWRRSETPTTAYEASERFKGLSLRPHLGLNTYNRSRVCYGQSTETECTRDNKVFEHEFAKHAVTVRAISQIYTTCGL